MTIIHIILAILLVLFVLGVYVQRTLPYLIDNFDVPDRTLKLRLCKIYVAISFILFMSFLLFLIYYPAPPKITTEIVYELFFLIFTAVVFVLKVLLPFAEMLKELNRIEQRNKNR